MILPRRLPVHHAVAVAAAGAAACLVAGCARPPEPAPSEPVAAIVENHPLGLRIAGLPAGFVVVVNQGERLVLGLADPAAGGSIELEVRPSDAGQNIPAAVSEHQELIEDRVGGQYFGAQELISQLGTTFYSRGRYRVDDVETEEVVVFALHPAGGRMMTITYVYPAGVDSSVRVQQLLEVLAVVEGI